MVLRHGDVTRLRWRSLNTVWPVDCVILYSGPRLIIGSGRSDQCKPDDVTSVICRSQQDVQAGDSGEFYVITAYESFAICSYFLF